MSRKTQVLKKWYITKYFSHSGKTLIILTNNGIWLFWFVKLGLQLVWINDWKIGEIRNKEGIKKKRIKNI